jgi:hypothetical protein
MSPPNEEAAPGQGATSKINAAQAYRAGRTLGVRIALPTLEFERIEAIHAGYVQGVRHRDWRRCPVCRARGWAA